MFSLGRNRRLIHLFVAAVSPPLLLPVRPFGQAARQTWDQNVPDQITASPEPPALGEIIIALEEQLRWLDSLGSMIAAAHVSAAVEHLRLDLAGAQLMPGTRH